MMQARIFRQYLSISSKEMCTVDSYSSYPATSERNCKTATCFADKLRYFYHAFNISHRAMDYLLTTLREEGLDVPKSVYLLNKEKEESVVPVIKSVLDCGGNLAYMSIQDNIAYCIRNGYINFKNDYNDSNQY